MHRGWDEVSTGPYMDARKRLIGALAALSVASAFASTPPPALPFDGRLPWPHRSTRLPATDFVMGRFNLKLERTTLADVKAAANTGTIEHQGDAGGSVYWLCYSVPGARVWLASSEMGGGDQAITEFDARPWRGAPDADCPSLPTRFQPLSIHGGLWLGARESAVRAALGTPSQVHGQWQSFNYEATMRSQCPPDGYDVMNWVMLRMKHSQVIGLSAGQITSC